MSQEKVAKYKEEKLKRKETVKKERRVRIIRDCLLALIPVAMVAVIGLTIFATYMDSRPRPSVDVKYDTLSTYEEEIKAFQ